MKLMDIDSDTLGIPDTDYDARVTLPSNEFTRIVRDLSQLGESVRIEVSKEGVRFASEGEAANGSVLLKQSESASVGGRGSGSMKGKTKKVKAENQEGEDEGDEDDESTRTKKINVKKEKEGDGDVEMNGDDEGDEDEFQPKSDGEGEDEQDNDDNDEDDDEGSGKKRKKKVYSILGTLPTPTVDLHTFPQSSSSKPAKKAKTSKSRKGKKKASDDEGDTDSDDFTGVRIEMNAHVSLTFSLKYLVNFSKSASLCGMALFLFQYLNQAIGIIRFRAGIYQVLPRPEDRR
jgi:proliferating cell nuclear antigen